MIKEPLVRTLRKSVMALGRSAAPRPPVFIGTAGWALPSRYASEFPLTGTHLERYATRLNAVEINSSFYRAHRRATYERWADSVAENFRFAVKLPREITHECALVDYAAALDRFTEEATGLGTKLGVVLVQLPPSLDFHGDRVSAFFDDLRTRFTTPTGIACEPRHQSWFTEEVERLLKARHIARVAADPPRSPLDHEPGGSPSLIYYRLHGAPQIYYSNYDAAALHGVGHKLAAGGARGSVSWCIFDNTAAQAALGNALTLASSVARAP